MFDETIKTIHTLENGKTAIIEVQIPENSPLIDNHSLSAFDDLLGYAQAIALFRENTLLTQNSVIQSGDRIILHMLL